MKPEELKISKEKFVFANQASNMHDKELLTKPVSYLHDAWNRFKKNKASITAAVIIAFLVLFAILAPLFSRYSVSYSDNVFKGTLPKTSISEKLNWNFYDGCENKELSAERFVFYSAMGYETGHNPIKNNKFKLVTSKDGKDIFYKVRLDTYQMNGMAFKDLDYNQYMALQEYQNETGIQVIYPATQESKRPLTEKENPNYWYKALDSGKIDIRKLDKDENGNYDLSGLKNIYKKYSGSDGYNSLRVEENGEKLYDYAELKQNNTQYRVRVNYYEYYIYEHSQVLKDGITKPMFLFGTSASDGKDIFTCLASGARFSFLLALGVSVINLIVGAIYGAIEGYYGGKIDLIMERFVEILSAVPFMIVITLLNYHMKGSSQVLILFIAFFLTGWIGMAGRTRMQFYRFKNQEYVLAARTLGASDKRIMFKHIFPNSLGTLITSCVLVIPGVIFSETSLSYLGIINLSTGNLTSVGTLLANGQSYLTSYPHMIVPPAIFISLLMLSFNLFGNGLRDAFNPSLRGVEE